MTGNRDELASAFGNLVSQRGPLHAGRRHDHARAGASTTTAAARSRSTDTGIGIAPEHLPRLTERFYRVDRSRSRATGGTGLGLAIVKHVLLRHQAELDDRPASPGAGSTFTVRLPARRVRRAPAGPSRAAPRRAEPTSAPGYQ